MIELLVVVAVIAILAGLLLPALSRARSHAQAAWCANNFRQLGLTCTLYADDFRDRLPYNVGADQISRWVAKDWYWNWTTPVMDWESSSDNTNAPLVTRGGIGPYTRGVADLYRCPADQVVSGIQAALGWTRRVRSISMNLMIGDAGDYSRSGVNVNNPDYCQFFKTTQLLAPSQIFVFIEEHPDSINDGYFLDQIQTGSWHDLPAAYHNGAANLSFADGHVEKHCWRFASTKPPARADAAHLPFQPPAAQIGDFRWLMSHTSLEIRPGESDPTDASGD